METAYPDQGSLRLTMEKGTLSCVQVAAVPLTDGFEAWKNGGKVPVKMENGLAVIQSGLCPGDVVTLTFQVVTEKVAPVSETTPKSLYKMMRGPRVLGKRQGGKSASFVPIGVFH